jgi:hypothetical protein
MPLHPVVSFVAFEFNVIPFGYFLLLPLLLESNPKKKKSLINPMLSSFFVVLQFWVLH